MNDSRLLEKYLKENKLKVSPCKRDVKRFYDIKHKILLFENLLKKAHYNEIPNILRLLKISYHKIMKYRKSKGITISYEMYWTDEEIVNLDNLIQ